MSNRPSCKKPLAKLSFSKDYKLVFKSQNTNEDIKP